MVFNDLKEIERQIEESSSTKSKSIAIAEEILASLNILVSALKSGNKILVCGNGGSAADAQHFAGELVGRFKMERRALPCIALTTDTSVITAWGNDYSFDTLFERQVEALGSKGDVLVAISTSGNSTNIIKAVNKAKDIGMKVITLLGKGGGKLKSMADADLIVPSDNTPRVQEVHGMIIHIWCDLIEKELFR